MAGALDQPELFSAQNALILGLVAVVIGFIFQKRSGSNQPPCYSGWLPYIGCAIEFGKAPLWFIEKSRKKVKSDHILAVGSKMQ